MNKVWFILSIIFLIIAFGIIYNHWPQFSAIRDEFSTVMVVASLLSLWMGNS